MEGYVSFLRAPAKVLQLFHWLAPGSRYLPEVVSVTDGPHVCHTLAQELAPPDHIEIREEVVPQRRTAC